MTTLISNPGKVINDYNFVRVFSSSSQSKRPNSLTDIIQANTPEIKSKRIKAPADRVLTSAVFGKGTSNPHQATKGKL